MNIQELKKVGVEELSKNNIDDAVIKANILLQFVLKMDRTEVIINCENMVNENRIEEYLSYVKEIVNGKPIQYITNNQSFMGLDFYVDEKRLSSCVPSRMVVGRVRLGCAAGGVCENSRAQTIAGKCHTPHFPRQ